MIGCSLNLWPAMWNTSNRQEVIEKKWSDLLAALEACKSTLSRYHDLMSVFSEMTDCLGTMAQIEVQAYNTHMN